MKKTNGATYPRWTVTPRKKVSINYNTVLAAELVLGLPAIVALGLF